jgi:hypothetical protein
MVALLAQLVNASSQSTIRINLCLPCRWAAKEKVERRFRGHGKKDFVLPAFWPMSVPQSQETRRGLLGRPQKSGRF